MSIWFIQEKQCLAAARKPKQPQDGQKLLFALAELVESSTSNVT